jgi:hypothetical protein
LFGWEYAAAVANRVDLSFAAAVKGEIRELALIEEIRYWPSLIKKTVFEKRMKQF